MRVALLLTSITSEHVYYYVMSLCLFLTLQRYFISRKNAQLPKTEMMRIEHLLRQGQRKLSMIQDPNVSSMGSFVEEPKKK
jgi:hypothetical protein